MEKRHGPSIEQTSTPFTQVPFVPSLEEISPVGLQKIFKFHFKMYFHYFVIILPLEKEMALHLKKLESPSPQDALFQVWLKLAQWFWRRTFLNFMNVYLLFRNYLPLEKGMALYLNKLSSASPRDALFH